MNRKYAFLSIFSFVVLTGFFSWLLIMKEIREKSGDSRSEIEKSLSEIDPNPKTTAQVSGSALAAQAAKTSNQKVASQPKTVPNQTNASEPIQTSSQPNTTPPPKEEKIEEDPLAGREKFESEKLKITLSYPSEFQIEEKERSLTLKKEEEKQIVLRIYENDGLSDIEKWFRGNFKEKDNADCQFLNSDFLKIGRFETKNVKTENTEGKCLNAGYYAQTLDKRIIGIFVTEGKETDEQIKKILETIETL